MKKLLFFVVVAFFMTTVDAQTAVLPGGGTATGNGGTVTYSLGQPADRYIEGSAMHVAEGVQQPYEFFTTGIGDFVNFTLNAVVFPNPTRHYVQLRITNYTIPDAGLNAQLFDINGKMLSSMTISDFQTIIDMEHLPSATYTLKIFDNKHLLKTFKIVKNIL